MLSLQIYKRLYECSCISVFSNSKMNVVHYLIGYLHYAGALTGLLAEGQIHRKGKKNLPESRFLAKKNVNFQISKKISNCDY